MSNSAQAWQHLQTYCSLFCRPGMPSVPFQWRECVEACCCRSGAGAGPSVDLQRGRSLVKLPNEREYKWPPTLTGGILEVSEPLTRAMRTDDSEMLFWDSFNDYGSMKPILFLLSSAAFSAPPDSSRGRKKKLFNMLGKSHPPIWQCIF